MKKTIYHIVKILSGDDYEEKENPVWCLVSDICGDRATFCSNEYFGFGVSSCKYEIKTVNKNGVTCPDCLEKIKKIKSLNINIKEL